MRAGGWVSGGMNEEDEVELWLDSIDPSSHGCIDDKHGTQPRSVELSGANTHAPPVSPDNDFSGHAADTTEDGANAQAQHVDPCAAHEAKHEKASHGRDADCNPVEQPSQGTHRMRLLVF